MYLDYLSEFYFSMTLVDIIRIYKKFQNLFFFLRIQNKLEYLLFEESNIIKQKYLSERPSTFEISQSVPGRVGRWLGWKIVSSFMSSSTYTLEELLKEDDYKNIFYDLPALFALSLTKYLENKKQLG